jgi:hypothetical protein
MEWSYGLVQRERPRPLLLLDIDGVLNPYAAAACPEGFREQILFPGEDPVWIGDAHAAWLKELSEAFEIVWASGWGEDAHLLADILSLPRLPLVRFPPVPFDPEEKLPAIVAYVEHRPAAWVDDALPRAAYEWAASRGSPTLLIGIDPAIGLRREHVDRLLAWAGELRHQVEPG